MAEHHPKSAPALDWRGDVPVARAFDDPYFSLNGGLDETRHVFLSGNDLPARFRPGFHIAELGFGTGLNPLATLQLWRASGQEGTFRFTSFEQFLMAPPDIARALSAYPELESDAETLERYMKQGRTEFDIGSMHLSIVQGDARATLPAWAGTADAWFLDGFSPAKNPELWEPSLIAQVARHTAPNGSCATYSAAGSVRAALADAGFSVERREGFGRKRHMTVARLT